MTQPDPTAFQGPLFLLLSLGMLLFGAGLAIPAVQLVRHRHPREDPPEPPAVGKRELLAGLLLFILGNGVVALLISLFDLDLDAGRLLALSAALMALASYPAIRSSLNAGRMEALGWVNRGSGRGLRTGIMIWFLLMPLFFGFNLFWVQVWTFFSGELPVQDVKELISGSQEGSGFVFLLAVLLVPFLEELVFRGILLNSLRIRMGVKGAVILSSLVFAALHGPAASGPIFVLALAMGSAMAISGNLFVPFALHAMNNGVQLILLSFASQL